MDPTALHCVEKPSVHANTPVPDILQKLEKSRLRLLNPVCPSGLWQKDVDKAEKLGLAHVESLWKGPEGFTKSDHVPEARETSGRNQNHKQSKLMPSLLRLENPCLSQPKSSRLPLPGLEESRARLLLPKENENEVDSFNDIPEYVLAMPEDEPEQLQEEDETLGSEIQEEDEGVAVKEKKLMFLSMVCCSLVEGARFGNPPGLLQKKLMKICKSLAECEPEFILKVALYARQELNIRSTANFLLALASYLQPCRPHVRRYFCHAVQLPSDWMQVAKLYQFRQFDAYQLAKYNTRKSRGKQRHKPKAAKSERNTSWDNWKKHKLGRNPVFAARYEALHKTRQDTMDSVKEEAVRDLFSLKNLIHRLHISEPAQHVMSLLGRRYPTDLPSFSRSRLPGPWDPALAGSRMQLLVPQTWDRQTWDRELSNRGNKAAVWEELIDSRKLPFMAMLRNLRNILRSGDSVIRSRQLPFRFLSAYKVILDLEKEFKEKDEPFPSNRHFVEKITKLLKLPMNFERRRYVRGCMEIPLIFQMVKKEKKKLLKSR
ncbi:Telomerase protein component 1, partial [Ophiophagus hannah]